MIKYLLLIPYVPIFLLQLSMHFMLWGWCFPMTQLIRAIGITFSVRGVTTFTESVSAFNRIERKIWDVITL